MTSIPDSNILSFVQASAYKKFEFIVTPKSGAILDHHAVRRSILLKFPEACRVYTEEGEIIVRFKSRASMLSSCESINKSNEFNFTARERFQEETENIEPTAPDFKPAPITLREYVKLNEMKSFIENYQKNQAERFPEPLIHHNCNTIFHEGNPAMEEILEKQLCANEDCPRESTKICSKTKLFFCSVECQETMFMKPERPKESETYAKGQKVQIVGYLSAKKIFIRRLEDREIYLEIMNKINRGIQMYKVTDKGGYRKGGNSLLFHENAYHRVLTLENLPGDAVRVLFLDQGFQRVVGKDKLVGVASHPLMTDIFSYPKCATSCFLADVKMEGISYECEELFKEFIAEDHILTVQESASAVIQLKVDHLGRSFNEMVNERMTIEVTNDGPSYLHKDLVKRETEYLDNVSMVMTDYSDLKIDVVCLAEGDYFKKCYEYENHFQVFADESKGNYTPLNEEICLVKIRSADLTSARWFRALGLLNVGDEHPRMELIDYGTVVKVHISCIRKIPKQLLYPPATRAYTIYGPSDHSNADSQFILDNLDVPFHTVTIPKIEEILQDGKVIDRILCPNLIQQIRKFKI